MKKWKNKVKEHFNTIIKTKSSTESLASGLAVGSFIGILPTPGFSFLLGFLILLILKKINKYALLFGIIFWNPVIRLPLDLLSLRIGNMIFGNVPIEKFEINFLNIAYNFSRRYLLGNLILSIVVSLAVYFGSYYLIRYIRKNVNYK